MESAKAPENISTEKTPHLPTPKVFFSKSKSQILATMSAEDSQPNMSANSTQILKSADESVKLSIGSHVIVGGVKEGILRFLGKVHFMEGDWCGVELSEPEGLHDGTVEQVRYFTCKNGHGIFAPQSKVALRHDRSSSNQESIFPQQARSGGDAESQFKSECSVSLENTNLVGGEPAQVWEKSMKPSKLARPRSVVSAMDIDLREASIQSKLPRPKSAVVSLSHADSNPDIGLQARRSSLMDYASLAKQQRASPKRVTFDDTLEYDLSSPHMSASKPRKSDFQGEGYTSDDSSYDSMTHHARFDPYIALTLTYDLESSPPRRKAKAIMRPESMKKPLEKIKVTSSMETGQLDSIQSAPEVDRLKRVISAGSVGDSNQGPTEQLLRDIFDRMDEEISNIPTPDTAEIQMIIPDSMSSSEEDTRRMFSSGGRSLTVTPTQKKQARVDSDRRLIKHSVTKDDDERSGEMRGGGRGITEDSLEGNHSEEHGLKVGAAAILSGNIGGELQALKKKASFELARTALAQYADLIRAAQEDRTHRLAKTSVKPRPQSCAVFDPSVEELETTEQILDESTENIQSELFDPGWFEDRTDQVKTFEDVELSGSVDSLNVDLNESLTSVLQRDGLDEYETFEGEDLRTISADDVIVIDSDEEFIEGERLAISGELGLADSLIIDSHTLINKPFQHPAAVSEGYQDLDDNVNDSVSVPVHREIAGQISEEHWNNTINNMRQYETDASTHVPLVPLRRRQQSRPVSMVSTASSDAGIGDDLLPCYGLKHERPISLISSTSSTDTGCAMDVDSDMLSSIMMSSTLDDLAESWQEPGLTSNTANWLKSYTEPDLQEKTKGHELPDYPVVVLPKDANSGLDFCITDVDPVVIKVEKDQKGLGTAELCGEGLLVGTGKDVIRTELLAKEIDLRNKSEESNSYEEVDSVVLKLESDSMQKESSYRDITLSSSSSRRSNRDDQLVLLPKGLSCAEVPLKLVSGVSVRVENSSKDMVNVAEQQPDVGFSSEIQNNLCSGLEPVMAKVLAVSIETPQTSLVRNRDLQVYMVSEDSGFAAGQLVGSEGACLGEKGSSTDKVQLQHTSVRKTKPEQRDTSANESRMEDKGDENKRELDSMVVSVKESYGISNDSFNVSQDLFAATTANSEKAKGDEIFSGREEIGMNEPVPSSENISAREKGLNKDKAVTEDTVKTASDEKNEWEEVRAGQKMNTGMAPVSLCEETIEHRGNEISDLKKESNLVCEESTEEGLQVTSVQLQPYSTNSMQELDNDNKVEDADNVGRRREEADGCEDLFQDAKAKQETMAVVSDGHSNICKVMAGSEILNSHMKAAIDMASGSARSNDSLVGAAESTKALLEVVEIDLLSGVGHVSDAIKSVTDGSDVESGKAENNILSAQQETVTALSGISEDHETVIGSSDISGNVLRLSEGSDTAVSESAGDSKKLLQLIENSDIMSETGGREMVDKTLLEQVKETEGCVSSDVMERTKTVIQDHKTRKSSVARGDSHEKGKLEEKRALKNVISKPSGNEEINEIAGMSTGRANDVTGGSELMREVTVNEQKMRVPEIDVTGGGNVSKGVRNDHTKSPSKLRVRGNVRGETSETLGQVKTKRGKADDKRDSKDDFAVGNEKAGHKAVNVGKSITNKAENVSGSIKLKKALSDVNKTVKDDCGADNWNTGRSLPISSRSVKSDSTNIRNVKVGQNQSNASRNTRNDFGSVADSVSTRQAVVRNQNKDRHSELPTDVKGNGRKKSASVSEPIESSTAKAAIIKMGGLKTGMPAKRSGVSSATLVPLSDRSVGRKLQSSQEALVGVDKKVESTQGNVKMGIGSKNPSHNPVSASVVKKVGSANPGSEGRGRPSMSNMAKTVHSVPEASLPMMPRKESIKSVPVNSLSSPRVSSMQLTKTAAAARGGMSNVTQGSSSSTSTKGIQKPGSAAGHNGGDKTIPKKQTKESEALKPSSKKPSVVTAKDAKSKADSSSQLNLQVNELKLQLKQTQQQLEGVVKEGGELQLKIAHIKEEQASEIRVIRQKHQQEIDSLKKAFVEQTKTEIEKVIDQHSHEVNTLKSYHDRHLSEAKKEHNVALEAREKEFQDAIAKLKAEHLKELNETKTAHEQHLNEISERFEEIKISLSSKVEQLRSRCDELCSRELCYKDTCKRESDLREQAALEVDSLRVVLEQRNGEIRKLRQQNALLDEKVQEIPVLKERITKLQQSIENLEAVNDLKSGHERQLADMHQGLLRKFERESKAMKRLSMENEELMWRLSQSDFGPSCLQEKFPPALGGVALMSRSYDSQHAATMAHRTRSNIDANQESTMSRSYDGFAEFYASTPKAASSRESGTPSAHSSSSSSIASGSSHSQRVKLRRSGTYEVMDQDNFEHKP